MSSAPIEEPRSELLFPGCLEADEINPGRYRSDVGPTVDPEGLARSSFFLKNSSNSETDVTMLSVCGLFFRPKRITRHPSGS